jgi:hypothetical protein
MDTRVPAAVSAVGPEVWLAGNPPEVVEACWLASRVREGLLLLLPASTVVSLLLLGAAAAAAASISEIPGAVIAG